MQLKKYPKTYKLLRDYLNLSFGSTLINCPYWINKVKKGIRGPYSGKGTPKQIVRAALVRARKKNVQLGKLAKKELRAFLRQNRIGVDCSGLVFNLANSLDRERGGQGIAPRIFNRNKFPDWNPAWRASAEKLTNDKVAKKINLKDIGVGDLIRNRGGRHVLFVVESNNNSLTYVHSSTMLTKETGVHLGTIKIVDWEKGLEGQIWLEKTSDGENFGKKYFNPSNGDSIKRFIWW